MSEFIDRVEAKLLHGRKAIPEPWAPLNASVSDAATRDEAKYCHRYIFSIEWRAEHYIEHGSVNAVLDNVKAALRDAVYSGFRNRLRDLEIAVYEHDRDAMLSAIRDLKREVFE